jgi:hypothetical protein
VETEGVSVIELRGELVSRCRLFYDTTEVAVNWAPRRREAVVWSDSPC